MMSYCIEACMCVVFGGCPQHLAVGVQRCTAMFRTVDCSRMSLELLSVSSECCLYLNSMSEHCSIIMAFSVLGFYVVSAYSLHLERGDGGNLEVYTF